MKLTRIEYKLLTAMVRQAGKVLTHQYLLEQVWGPKHAENTQYLRVFMAGLRRKVEFDPAQPRHLLDRARRWLSSGNRLSHRARNLYNYSRFTTIAFPSKRPI